MEKSDIIKKLEEEGIIVDVITICPYCGNEVGSINWQLGCCGESSEHFVEGYLFSDDTFMTEEEIIATYKSSSIH